MTDTIRALLEKAEPDARTERDSVGCHIVASCVLYTGQKFFAIDTVCAALSASAAVKPVDAELLGVAMAFLEIALSQPSIGACRQMIREAMTAIRRAESAQPKEAEKVCEWRYNYHQKRFSSCKSSDYQTPPTNDTCPDCGGKIVEVTP